MIPHSIYICLALFSLQVSFLFCPSDLLAQELTKIDETKYATIHYSTDSDLNTFTRNISGGFTLFGGSKGNSPKNRIDKIVERVCELLDMHPPDLQFKIYSYSTFKELELEYRSITFSGMSPTAFYNHKTRTIYISVQDITDGILAHEIAHAVINLYFGVPPPRKMQEVLAQYVDKHLWGN